MVMMAPIDILESLREGVENYESAILTTFNFDPDFFESTILPILQSKEAGNILVMTDISEYMRTFGSARHVGTQYYLEPIQLKGTFHPKIIWLTSGEIGKLIIGSCNITEQGYRKNAEIVVVFDYSTTNLSVEAKAMFFDVKDFFTQLIRKGYTRSQKHASKILEAMDVPWIPATRPVTSRVRLVHNLEKPIISQVQDILGEEKVDEITIVCNDFDPNAKLIKFLHDNLCKKIKIVVQPGNNNFPLQQMVLGTPDDVTFSRILFHDKETRAMHGKIVIFKMTNGSHCLIGSANATVAALLLTSETGNIEACILRSEQERDYFDYLLNNENVSIERINPDQINPYLSRPEVQLPPFDLTLTDARIENQKKLIVEFVPAVAPKYRLVHLKLCRSIDSEPEIMDLTLKNMKENTNVSVEFTPALISYVQDSCWVSLEFRVTKEDVKPLISNQRWITTERQELLVGFRRDIETIKRTDGRFGLIRLLNRVGNMAETPDILLYYLSFLDFYGLFDVLNHMRRQIMRVPSVGEEGLIEEPTLVELPHLTSEDILSKILNRHMKRFEKLVKGYVPSSFTTASFEKLFNLFMFMNKITVWFVLKENATLNNFRFIRKSIEMLCSSQFIARLKKDLGDETAKKLIDALNVLIHVMTLAKIVHDFQESDALWRSQNKNVIKFFNETFREALKNLYDELNVADLASIPLQKISSVLKEYGEFEILSLTAENVLDFAAWLMRST